MKIVVVSNFLSPHQISLCEELYERFGNDFIFVTVEKIPALQAKMGYYQGFKQYEIVFKQNKKLCKKLILDADIVLFGSVNEKMFLKRLKQNKLTFRWSERFYKDDIKNFKLTRLKQWYHHGFLSKFNSFYYLACSAYLANDLSLFNNRFEGRILKWNYFPKLIDFNTDIKVNKPIRLLWVGRLVPLKRPQWFLDVCKLIKEKNFSFTADIIGDGPLKEEVVRYIHNNDLSSCITYHGFMKNEDIRTAMNNCDIFITTSTKEEGWGVVINEALNAKCAVIASQHMGATPFLIKNGFNGFSFSSQQELFDVVIDLIRKPKNILNIKCNASIDYEQNWSAKVAVDRILFLHNNFVSHGKIVPFENGICSLANKMNLNDEN